MKQSLLGLTPAEKKEYAKRIIANGDTRSYNEVMADLELAIWNQKHSGFTHNA